MVEDARLALVRRLIDAVDDGLVVLLAGRRRLVGLAADRKGATGRAAGDTRRERTVRERGRRVGAVFGVPSGSSDRLLGAVIADARRQQGLPAPEAATHRDDGSACRADAPSQENDMPHSRSPVSRWLRWFPPPKRWAPWLQRLPARPQAACLEAAFVQALRAPLANGALDLLENRRIGIEVSDLGLRWIVTVRNRRLHVDHAGPPAEVIVRGEAADLLLLASRREDADTLFFQRRLVLAGDVELGLTARNLLDQLPWQDVPLAQRIVLHRCAGWAEAARAAYRGART